VQPIGDGRSTEKSTWKKTLGMISCAVLGGRAGFWLGDKVMFDGQSLPAKVIEYGVESMFTLSGAITATALGAFAAAMYTDRHEINSNTPHLNEQDAFWSIVKNEKWE